MQAHSKLDLSRAHYACIPHRIRYSADCAQLHTSLTIPHRPPDAAESLLNGWKARTNAFELVQWDVALEGQDPHAVGVAVKGQAYRPGAGAGASSEERRAEREAREARERAEREAKKEKARLKKDRGFDKTAGGKA